MELHGEVSLDLMQPDGLVLSRNTSKLVGLGGSGKLTTLPMIPQPVDVLFLFPFQFFPVTFKITESHLCW